jgi:zinc transport system substrate-binding protein
MTVWKRIGLVLTLAAAMVSAAGCGAGSGSTAEEPGRVRVVASFYPLAFLAGEIGGERAHVVNLVPAGVEPHDWTPKSRDMQAIARAQLFLYNGAGFEGWVEDVLGGFKAGEGPLPVEASRGVRLIRTGENGDREEGHDHGEHPADGHAHDDLTVDPHTWVSPKSALIMAENLYNAFVRVDGAHRAHYEANYRELAERLKALDERYTRELSGLSKREVVVSHAAFGYLCRDYGLRQVAIMGLSPEAEPRAQDLLAVKRFVEERGVKVIFFEELVSDRLARTLAQEAKVDTLVLNPLEGLTPAQEKAGETYLTLMERNLEHLKQALQ